MMTSLRSLRCLSRRHLARISIIDMFGESSMNSGASATSLIRRASRVQSSSLIWPGPHGVQRTRASADSSRMVISLRLISSVKITVVTPCLTAATAQSPGPGWSCGSGSRSAGQVHVVGVIDLDTAHRDARHRADIGDEPGLAAG